MKRKGPDRDLFLPPTPEGRKKTIVISVAVGFVSSIAPALSHIHHHLWPVAAIDVAVGPISGWMMGSFLNGVRSGFPPKTKRPTGPSSG